MLRFDATGAADRLPALLETARQRPLSAGEAQMLADALAIREPWLEWAGKGENKWLDADPVALHIHERVSAQAILKLWDFHVNRDPQLLGIELGKLASFKPGP